MSSSGRCVAGLVLFVAGAALGGSAMHLWNAPAGTGTETGSPIPKSLEATILVPLADNQGRRFTNEEWQDAVGVLTHTFGGATLGEPQEGWWVNGRRELQREPIRPVIVSFAPDRLDEFRQQVRQLGKRLGQETMYVRFEEPRIDIISVAPTDVSTPR